MIPKSLRVFMEDLLAATDKKTISWSEGALPDAYYCAHKDYNLHINYFFDENAELGVYNFRIIKGQKDAAFSVTSEEDDFSFMRNLHGSISVNANDLDNIVQDFFGIG